MGSQYFTLPTSVSDSLRCTLCRLYLSRGPLSQQKSGSEKFICGRCPRPNDSISELLYEQAMTKFVFPCVYDDKGCTENLLFNNVDKHELNCKYRPIQCPITHCMQIISRDLIKQHFSEQHPNSIMKNGSNLEFQNENTVSWIMINENSVTVLFCYSYDWDKKLLNLKGGYLNKTDDETVNCKVQLNNPNGLSSDLFYADCNVYKHPIVETVPILLESCPFDCANGYNICIKVKITTNQASNSKISSLPVSEFMKDGDDIEANAIYLMSKLDDLECAKCRTIIIPPIYKINNVYDTESLYCKECVPKYGSIVKFEKKIDRFPCRWRGCSAICTGDTIKQHVDRCEFKTHICLFCKSTQIFLLTKENIRAHLERHAFYCSNPENIRINLFDVGNKSKIIYYFTIFENKIVYFTCTLNPEDGWTFDCQFEKGVQISVGFEHDHCRLRVNDKNSHKTAFTICSKYTSFPECFKSYYLLRIILRVESCEEET